MTDTFTRDERRSALDDFADSLSTDTAQALAPAAAFAPPVNQVVGAQALAVHRDTARVLKEIKVLAAAAGTEWYYRYPVKNKKLNRTDWIEGPSIKLANDIARLYGNCEVDCRAQDMGNVILYHARFIDLETGYALTRPFQQRKGAAKIGGDDENRREDITFQIGASKAIRNVVVNALQTFSDFAFEEAKQALVDKIGSDIERWRTRTMERIGAHIDLKRVEAVIGRTAAMWLAPDIARVIAMGKAVDDGMATWAETFPSLDKQPLPPHDPSTGEVLDDFADEKAMVDPGGAAGSFASSDSAKAAPAGSANQAGAATDDRPEIIAKLLQLAAEKVPAQDRLETLDVTSVGLKDRYPTLLDFVTNCINTTAQIIKGELSAAQARKYLEGLIK